MGTERFLAGARAVASDERDFWARNGYLPVPDLFPRAAVDEVAAILDELFDRRESIPQWTRYSVSLADGTPSSIEINMTVDLDARLRATEVFASCRAYAADLLQEPVVFDFDHAIRKSAGVGSGTGWHQDCAYYPYERERDEHRVHFWIPMADVTAAGSAMRYIPGSQRTRMLRHDVIPTDENAHYKSARDFDESDAVDVPVTVGGAVLHHPVTLHASSANTSTVERTAWILHFARPRTVSEELQERSRRLKSRAARLMRSGSATTA